MYMMNTRPDICFVVNTLIQFLTDIGHVQLIVANHILRYLKGSSMRQIRRLTWRVMLIQIGQKAPAIGRALQGVASVWDQV